MIHKPILLWWSLLLVGGLLVACNYTGTTPAQEEVALRLQLREASIYRFRTTTIQTMDASFLGEAEGEIVHDIAVTARYAVEQIEPDGTAWVAVTYEDISWIMEAGGERVDLFSSGFFPESSKAMTPKLLVGQSLRLQFAPDGSVSRSEGMENLLATLEESSVALQGTGNTADSREYLFGWQTGKRGMFGVPESTLHFPPDPIVIGASWPSETQTVINMIPFDFDTTYILQRHSAGLATIALDGTIAQTEAMTSTAFGLRFENLTGSQRGVLQVDETTGLLSQAEVSYAISATVALPSMDEVTRSINEGLSEEMTATTGLENSGLQGLPQRSLPFSASGKVTHEQLPCCDPLPTRTPRPTPTAVPTPGSTYLKELVFEALEGVDIEDVELVATHKVLDRLVVIYRGTRPNFTRPGLETPTADGVPEPSYGYIVFRPRPDGWESETATFAGIGEDDSRYLTYYDWGVSFTMQKSASFVLGRPAGPQVAAVEASFADGQVVRKEQVPPGEVFLLVAEDVDEACTIRVFDSNGRALDEVSLMLDPGLSSCNAAGTPTVAP